MNYFKRALLSVWKSKTRSILLTIAFLIIATLILSGISIQSAAQREEYEARMSLGASVTVMYDTSKSQFGAIEALKSNVAESLSKIKHVVRYNYYLNSDALAVDFNPIVDEATQNQMQKETKDILNGSPQYNTIIVGYSDTSISSEFVSDGYKLLEGRHITKADEGKSITMISKQIADKNNLKLGDKISIQSVGKTAIREELTIVGIFIAPYVDPVMAKFVSSNPNDVIFVYYKDAGKLQNGYDGEVLSATYFLDDPANISGFKK